ncbi:MAG TPA: sigma-70 family RNA polymerase sigma factor [Candidatus Hydrogenedentes bacterium]|nr:sigma-70 family RNA polymerase sigma factor [Candidatus Hydrogenedentota bacterium]HOS02651.1 sigma-70 family RNA polymerase sigma factor [Candidatus Hydrogenedentota bacterium]
MAEGVSSASHRNGPVRLRVLPRGETPFSEWNDEELMLEHARGTEAAFEELVRRHQKGVLNYTYRMVQNRQIAEELTQEVFLALVQNAQRYQPLAKFTTYLYAIASNIVSKEWARRKRRPALFSLSSWAFWKDPDDAFDPLEHVSDAKPNAASDCTRTEVSEAVNKALRTVPEQYREAFILHRMQDLSYEEVSEITNAPIGTVKSRVVRAERALRPLLESFRDHV